MQIAGVIVWGLSVSTLLTLAVTPALLAAPEIYAVRLRAARARLRARRKKQG